MSKSLAFLAQRRQGICKEAADPVPWEGKPYGPTNRVAAAWGVFRDRYILDTIQDVLGEYKKVFIVYGASHAVILEPALRKLMSSKQTLE